MRLVLFTSLSDACVSQMAAAWFNHQVDKGRVCATSAGHRPAAAVAPGVVEAMKEVGIDLGDAKPRMLHPGLAKRADLVVALGWTDPWPGLSGPRREAWAVGEVNGHGLERIRPIRDLIHARVDVLVASKWYW